MTLDETGRVAEDAAFPPSVLAGRYRLERRLGIGGMASVYSARDLLREQFGDPEPYVAVKMLNDELAACPDASALLHGEFALAMRLHHRHVVRVFGFEVDMQRERAFMTLELMLGVTLDRVLVEHPAGLPRGAFHDIAHGLLGGLAHVHASGVVHGDLKPSNVMLTDSGARLFDFGLGQACDGILQGLPSLSRERFNAWTPRYAALELLDSGHPTMASDLFAVACVLYELLTGQHPYPRLVTRQKPALRLERQLQCPARLHRQGWRALRTALALNVEDRDISAAQLGAALQKPP